MFQFRFPHKEKGQGLVEYALILVLVSITVIVVLSFLGDSVGRVFQTVDAALNGQNITGTGTEYVIGSFTPNASGGPLCTVTVAPFQVTQYDNGESVGAGQSITVSATATGGGSGSGSGTTNANGTAMISSITMTGSACNGTVTITVGGSSRSAGY